MFLKNGFPRSGAPFLSFGWLSYNDKFNNIYDYYSKYMELDEETKNFWIFGSDGGGNPICFDTSNEDRLVLLDHESGFEMIDELNVNIKELAQCLLFYKEFIQQIQNELGEDAYIEEKYTNTHVNTLKEKFLSINLQIFNRSGFWDSSVNGLLDK